MATRASAEPRIVRPIAQPTAEPATPHAEKPITVGGAIGRGLRLVLLVCAAMVTGALLLEFVLRPALAVLSVQETFTATVARLLVALLPAAVYLCAGMAARPLRRRQPVTAVAVAWGLALVGCAALIAYSAATATGAFQQAPTLGITFAQTPAGVEVLQVAPGGAGEAAGVQIGDMITAVRRDAVTAGELQTMIAQAAQDDVFRLRIVRAGEELQLPARIAVASNLDAGALARTVSVAVLIAGFALFLPAAWTTHLLLIGSLLPLFVGYLWLIIATFSQRTYGLFPVNTQGEFGGLTLENWRFLNGEPIGGPTINIFTVTLNSLAVAVSMTLVSLLFCSMAGYALSRMTFPGRRALLQMTLILHGFPAVTLIIPIFLVLLTLGSLPVVGRLIGYDSVGGVALVMIAFELPLGIWLMKGFFDAISWDMERSALIDGASRFRTFWEIILPQIRPGLLALGIFSFIGGWNAYLVPATYSVGTGLATLPVYIQQLAGELTPVNWNQVAAVGLFQLIPIFVFFIFAQEHLLNIYAGGTKGSS